MRSLLLSTKINLYRELKKYAATTTAMNIISKETNIMTRVTDLLLEVYVTGVDGVDKVGDGSGVVFAASIELKYFNHEY